MSLDPKVKRKARTTWFAIVTEHDVSRLVPDALAHGRVRLVATETCENCGAEIHSGRRNDESERDLKARLKGRRAAFHGSELSCANCGKLYDIFEDGKITEEDKDALFARGMW